MQREEQRGKVQQFLALTGSTDSEAAEALLANCGWDVAAALECVLRIAVEDEHGLLQE